MRRVLLAVALLALPACAVHNLDFRVDKRVKILTPRNQGTTTLPVTLQWSSTGLPAGTTFAVFVDTQPIQPGRTLRSLADQDCKKTPGCPDAAYLAAHRVYTTSGDQLAIPQVPANANGDRTGPANQHEATIVLLDRSGHRTSEGAYSVDFYLKKGS